MFDCYQRDRETGAITFSSSAESTYPVTLFEMQFRPQGDLFAILDGIVRVGSRDSLSGMLTIPPRVSLEWDDPRNSISSVVFSPDGRYLYGTSLIKSEVHWFEVMKHSAVRHTIPNNTHPAALNFTVKHLPSRSHLFISVDNADGLLYEVSLMSINGKVARQWSSVKFCPRNKSMSLDISGLKPGTYIARIYGKRSSNAHRILLLR